MIEKIVESLSKSIVITIYVFFMMIIVDYINILTQGRIKDTLLKSKRKQYIVSSFLGATPGCLGAFMSVSMYVHGIITFGALTACMIATSGDEAFVMLTLFPRDAIILFLILFVIGIISGILTDKIIKKFRIKVCKECLLQEYHDEKIEKIFSRRPRFSVGRAILFLIFALIIIFNIIGAFGPEGFNVERIIFLLVCISMSLISIFSSDHHFREHIVGHIAKKHIWRVFLWTFGALIIVNAFISTSEIRTFIQSNMNLVLIISALVGIIPESGPHMVFAMMYDQHLIPFSVLLTSSIVQDGHGMLPLFSYTVKDAILMKIVNLAIGLIIGFILYFAGL